MLTGQSAELLAAMQRTLPRWNCDVDGDRVLFHRRSGHGQHVPPRHPPSWAQLLATLESACTDHGIHRAPGLPLHGLGDADLTFSAVQALDPYLKQRQQHTYGSGFLPQAVVRFTGDRDEHGDFCEGFASSFVNTSIVQPITAVADHAALIDTWLAVLSRAGFHTRHLTIAGTVATWNRPPVNGITLRFQHQGRDLGDAVLLWNADDPTHVATDIGSGLERIRWALTGESWRHNVFGRLVAASNLRILDAVRTATLIVGSGIGPASRGPGNAVRRLLRDSANSASALGLSRVVRWSHEYWGAVHSLPVPWPEVCRVLEAEAFDDH